MTATKAAARLFAKRDKLARDIAAIDEALRALRNEHYSSGARPSIDQFRRECARG